MIFRRSKTSVLQPGPRRKPLATSSRRKRTRMQNDWQRRLLMEPLEDRRLLAVITVDSILDNTNDDGRITLREAIIAANNDAIADPTEGTQAGSGADTINFVFSGGGIGGGPAIILTLGELEITEALTIDGPGQTVLTIDAQDNSRIFRITATTDDFTIAGLTLTGGKTTVDGRPGGAIRSSTTGNLTIAQSTVIGNSTTGISSSGGGVAAFVSLTLVDSTVTGNSTVGEGAFGGGVEVLGTVTLVDSTVSGNSTAGDNAEGGGVWAFQTVTLTRSIVTGNSTAGNDAEGGGLYALGAVTLFDSTVSGNRTLGLLGGGGGGGVWAGGDLMLFDSTVSDNSAGGVVATGGGVHALAAVTLVDSTVSGNRTLGLLGGSGGGLWAAGDIALFGSTISGNSTTGNSAGGGGVSGSGDVTLDDSTISGNITTGDGAIGGGVRASGDVTLKGSTVSGNRTTGSGALGGGVWAGGSVHFVHSTVTDNHANYTNATGGGIWAINDPVTISGSIVAGNTAGGGSPDLRAAGTSVITVRYSLIGDNSGTGLVEANPDADGNIIGGPIGGVIDPLLGALATNGGPTKTHALSPGSPALDTGDPAAMAGMGSVPSFDQRLAPFVRVFDGDGAGGARIDMGAYELQTLPLDRFEPNDTLETATVLGSLPKITLRDLSIHDENDFDFFKVTAQDTGKLIINALFDHVVGDIDIFVVDMNHNLIASSRSKTDNEKIVIPVVTQEMYFIEVVGQLDAVNNYSLEIENFPAPVPDFVDLPPKYRDAAGSLILNDTGMSQTDDITFRTDPEIIIEADLHDFFDMGISILTSDEANAMNVPGAAVQVFVNGNAVGYANPIAGTGNTLFRYTFGGVNPILPRPPFFPADSGGILHYVKAAVQIIDGQQNPAGNPAPAKARTQLSEPLVLMVDPVPPAAPSAPDLIGTSDSGVSDTDDITDIKAPAFQGTGEMNAKIRIFANGVLVGQGFVGSDLTDGVENDQIGHWEVTVEPLKYGQYVIEAEVEDIAGNISPLSGALPIVVDPYEPNDTLAEATILGSLQEITINDVLLHNFADVDIYKYTAHDTGKVIVNAFSADAIGLRVRDVNGNVIATAVHSTVTAGLDIDHLVIPKVSQEEYFIEVFFDGIIPPPDGPIQHVAIYDLEIEDFPAPVPDFLDLPPKYRDAAGSLILNDTGMSQTDDITRHTTPVIHIEVDLEDFFQEGITILTADQANAMNVPGAAVEVFLNDSISLGFADAVVNPPIPPGTASTTLFRFQLPDPLPEHPIFEADSVGELLYVKAAVKIIDGQRDPAGNPDPAKGRTQLSEPLVLVIDTVARVGTVPNLLDSSDSGMSDTDNVTKINTPAFDGIGEMNNKVRIFAREVAPGKPPLLVELVGQGFVGSDMTDGVENDQFGTWEVTIEPLRDGIFDVFAEYEDLAGNISTTGTLRIEIDTEAPNTPYLDLVELDPNTGLPNDTGRHNDDNVINITGDLGSPLWFTMTVSDGPNPPVPHLFNKNFKFRLFDRDELPNPPLQTGGPIEVKIFDSFTKFTDFFSDPLNPNAAVLTEEVGSNAGWFVNKLDGSGPLSANTHNLKLEVEDRAGNISHDFLLPVVIDTKEPPKSFGFPVASPVPGDATDGLHPESDSGKDGPAMGGTFTDNVTNDTTPTLWGEAEANSIVRLYVDMDGTGTVTLGDIQLGEAVAIPLDGNDAEPDGRWEITSTIDLNDPIISVPLGFDGLRTLLITGEDLAGNVNVPAPPPPLDPDQVLNIFIDTQGPRIFDPDGAGPSQAIQIGGNPTYDLFDPKGPGPAPQPPTPLVNSLVINVEDLPSRVAPFLTHLALANAPGNHAEDPGHYVVRGDHNGIIPIKKVTVINVTPVPAGSPATATITLEFFEPLPDDRFTLTISDELKDPAGNRLDGESNAAEPQEDPIFPSGDGQPGGNFVARFTVDSRPEIGSWAGGSVAIDTNGNFVFDPEGKDRDNTNEDIVYMLGLTSDDIFAGNFAGAGGVADGFDKLAAYGRFGGNWRWRIDTNNDGVIDLTVPDPAGINGLPVAGNFDGNAANGDEVAVYTGSTWWIDANHDFLVDTQVSTPQLVGYPIVGDFDGDGFDDLGTWADDVFSFQLTNGVPNGWLGGGGVFRTIAFGFIGARERPVAADMDQDGIDDIGLWVPDRSASTVREQAEWFFLVSNDFIPGDGINDRVAGQVNTLNHDFKPEPFGQDLLARFGDQFALPVVGNFDPPVAPSVGDPVEAESWNAIYDLDGDGRVGFGDLAWFASAFLQNVEEADDGLVEVSDFDDSGRVDFSDFALFAANFGRREGDGLGEMITASSVSAAVSLTVEGASAAQTMGTEALMPIVFEAVGRSAALKGAATAPAFENVTPEVVDASFDASLGWYLDATFDGELPLAPRAGMDELFAEVGNATERRLDLLTAAIYELDDRLGDDDASIDADRLWDMRRLPGDGSEADELAEDHAFDTELVDEFFARLDAS